MLRTFADGISRLRAEGRYRHFFPTAHSAAHPGRTGRDEVEVWCSNDYLGLSQHPELIRAQVASTVRHGTGMGGSRNIGGTSTTHVDLEERLARWHGKERALIFSSGYTANFETLSVLLAAVPDLVVFSDAANHRSLIEGIRRSGRERHVFRHNDVDALETALRECPPEAPKLIVFESVYSMDADLAPLTEICDLADRYDALTYLDETHAIGVKGPTGAGVTEELGEDRPTFIQGVFGKALGTVGGYVAGPDVALDYVRSHAPGFIFTTSLPQSSLDATAAGLHLVQAGSDLRATVAARSKLLKDELRRRRISFIDGEDHIIPVLVPGNEAVRGVADRLLVGHRIYVQPINFPSVAAGSERLRVTVPPYRTEEDVIRFVDALDESLALENVRRV
ncbi:5-aminolevulinate synthase [Saccharothrix tamanrassetensis]|uniref:8-amino-7-oxononanoate synthase n=1 Tax=Saccharothrix tamanrassetensis TaxID=1051531 RepID=A0A841C950_9PSEU|nr:5-aminolevulinate synthase [Saccharothrix tamanrassetensis]MBB5953661.1 5-aminolevulinate synthase [Saccharothrix tamanrassetensis]